MSDHWQTLARAPASHLVEFRLNLHHRNLEVLEAKLAEISDPDHASYGEWMSKETVDELVNPLREVREAVRQFALRSGAKKAIDMGSWIKVTSTVEVAEKTLNTRLFHMKPVGSTSSKVHVKALDHFKLPAEVAKHVQSIGGSLAVLLRPTKFQVQSTNAQGQPISCTIVPQTLEVQYNINNRNGSASVHQGVAEFSSDNGYSPSDLSVFSTHMKVGINGKVVNKGIFNPDPPDAESTLDIQYVASTGRSDTNYFWVVDGWLHEWTQDVLANAADTSIWSISWGADERQEGISYNQVVETNFMKMNARGTTILASSGDTGAPGTQCGSPFAMNPSYPASSQYVLAVGATMFTAANTNVPINTSFCSGSSANPPCAISGTEAPAQVPEVNFASGGGFSTMFPQPSWQKTAVSKYLSRAQLPPASNFNRNNRGYPDVGAIGWNVIIRLQGQWTPIGGTSASSPIFAGMLGVAQQITGKKRGLINPLIYKAAEAGVFRGTGSRSDNNFNGCGSQTGFYNDPNGWNPVVGLGVLDFGKFVTYLKTLDAKKSQ